MPTDAMTTKRMSFQQQTLQQHSHHQQQQQQRRPPDVEEALSSMLWTPYERASITDTSSEEDDDEQLQRQLKRSKSQYDYTSVPTTIPPLTPPASLPSISSFRQPPTQFALPSAHSTPANVVAYITTATPTTRTVAATGLTSTTNSYYTAEDLCDPCVTTPLVPFSNLMLNGQTAATTTTITTTPNTHLQNTAILAVYDGNEIDDSGDVSLNEDDTFNDVFNNDNTLAATSSSKQMMSSYQQKNRISSSSSYGRLPGLTKWWSTSSATQTPTASNSIIEPTSATAITPLPLPTPAPSSSSINPTDNTNKKPPSYESLYKKHPLRPLRQRHRFNKHLNLFKPVLETLKANVTTITQGRFPALTQTVHNRVTNTTLIQSANAGSERTTTTASATATTTITTEATSVNIENNCSTESTSNNLDHSFTDNFLHEHCLNKQHVDDTNVDNEHIINNNNINNNNNITTENIHGETPLQQQTMIHLQQHAHKQMKNMSNVKPKQNEDGENKQNNNFIISQQQKEQHTKCEEHNVRETCKNEMIINEFTTDQFNTMNHPKSSPLLQAATNFTTTTKNTASLFYDSSSAISLTRSFEIDTSFTIGLTVEHDSFVTDLQNETRKTTTTYSLTPNKCLAELERLYAEFRASESLREQKLRELQNPQITTSFAKMRLNVAAPTSETVIQMATDVNEGKLVSEATRLNPSTSSVFLTTTNSVTALTNPCQRNPSLTIQVNQSSNNDNKIQENKKIGQHENNESQMGLNQAIVNSTTNGVSVINCNYVNNVNNNKNNNNANNKSITNLSDNATNTNQCEMNTIPTNYSVNNINMNNNNNDCSPNHYTNLNSISKNISVNYNSDTDNIPNTLSQCSMSQVLNVKDIKNHQVAENYQKHLKVNSSNTQVKIIQVNQVAGNTNNESTSSSSSSTPNSSPQRTFASTESQTDDVAAVQLKSPSTARQLIVSTNSNNTLNNNRDQRRRERRERRHLQHTASLLVAATHSHYPHVHPLRHGHLDRHSMPAPPLPPILHPPHLYPGLAGNLQQTGHNVAMLRPMLPDILHNHFPPPYSALPSQSIASGSGHIPHHNGSPITFNHQHPHHPPQQTSTATILGPPPQPPPTGTTLLTSVISTVPIPGATPIVSDGRFTLPLPIIRRSPSERSGKGCCGQWFAGPPLRALIAVVALGGFACALGGAALGATGLAGPPSSHFTAALLMIGVGVVLVTVSGAAWRMTAPGGPPCLGLGSSVDLGRCGRRPCRRGGGAPQGLLYPEFQHRPPPPSYQASMQEYRLRLLLLDRDRQNGVVRGSSPPPTYRSHAGSLLRAPLASTVRGTGAGNRCESSIGGSEYSFPPSYRSRNTTPGIISCERSIETEPSGRLLANEDIPEPLSVEQLSEYNSLQQRCNNSTNANGHKSEQKRNSLQLDTNILISKNDTNLNNLNSDKKDDLVTIVTITPQNSDNLEASENRANHDGGIVRTESRDQIEILAHL